VRDQVRKDSGPGVSHAHILLLAEPGDAQLPDLCVLTNNAFSHTCASVHTGQDLVINFSATRTAREENRLAWHLCAGPGPPPALILERGSALSPLPPQTLAQDANRPTVLSLIPDILDARDRT
jgi:hypothetical protein